MYTVGDVFNQHYSTLDSWFIRNLARWKTQFSDSLNSLHILFYWASIQFGIQVPYCPCLAPVAGNLLYLETLQQGWGTCDPRTRCGPREHCLRPKSELSLPKSKHNIAPKQNSWQADMWTASKGKSLSILNIVLSPYYSLKDKGII